MNTVQFISLTAFNVVMEERVSSSVMILPGVNADIYTMAKGMGNGFPVAGIIIAPHIKPKHFQLGTTFGGNHLACAAALGCS